MPSFANMGKLFCQLLTFRLSRSLITVCNARTEGQINEWKVGDETEGWNDLGNMQRKGEGGKMKEGQANYLQVISIHVTNKLKQRNKKQQKQKKLPQISHTREKL